MTSSRRRTAAAHATLISAAYAFICCAHAGDTELTTAFEDQEARYMRLREVSNIPSLPAPFRVTDKRGKTISDDVRANVLGLSVVAEIESLRSTLRQQLNDKALEAAEQTLSSLTAALDKEIATSNAISDYWASGAKNSPDRASHVAYLRKNGIEPRYASEIETAQQQVDEQIGAARFGEAVSEGYPALVALLKRAAREENEAVIQKIGNADFSPFVVKERTTKCPSAARVTSGTGKPKLQSAGAGNQNYYPGPSKRLAEEGTVYVMVHVSAVGCPQRATVTVSSGFPRLDGATLSMMLDSQFLPAEQNGRAVRAEYFTLMNWELKETR